MVPGRVEPLLGHCGSIAGQEVIEHVFSGLHHAGDVGYYLAAPGAEVIVAECARRGHVLGVLAAEIIDIGVACQGRYTCGAPFGVYRVKKRLLAGGAIPRWRWSRGNGYGDLSGRGACRIGGSKRIGGGGAGIDGGAARGTDSSAG